MEVFELASKSTRYTPEFKRQMVALAYGGRTARSLSKEYGPTPWTIALWIQQDKRDAGKGDGGLTTAERGELSRLRRESNPAAPPGLPVGLLYTVASRPGRPGTQVADGERITSPGAEHA